MFTLLAVSLLILHAFSLFSLPSFSFHVFLSLCLPLAIFIYSLSFSLSYASSVYSFKKNTFIDFLFKKNLFICSSLLAKLFLFYLLCCFAPFSHLFLQSCSFEQEKLTPFFFWQKNNLFKTSKNFFSEILSFDVFNQKNLSSFFEFFFWNLFFEKSVFLNFVQKIPQNGICNQQCLSRSHFLIIFSCWEKYPSLQLSKKNVFYHLFLVSLIVRKFSWKKISFDKIVSLKKTKLLLSPLDFCSIFFFESKNSSIFQLSFYFFGLLCFSRFSFSVCFFLVSFIFSFFFF